MEQGDCLDLMWMIPDNSVDMILCDLPYGTTQNKWDSIIDLPTMWAHYLRIVKHSGAIVLTAAQPFTTALISSNIRDFKYCWVWVKNRPTLAVHSKNRPMAKHEDIAVFSAAKWWHAFQLKDNRMNYFPQGAVGTGKIKVVKEKGFQPSYNGTRLNLVGKEYEPMTNMPNTILEFAKDEDHLHPTQKPVALMEYLIRTYTNEGDTVLDNCMGSGTTGVACANTGRNFIGFERDADYFKAAENRVWAAWASSRMV